MPLTAGQSAFVDSVDTGAQAIEDPLRQVSKLLRAVRNWDAGLPDPLVDAAMTADQVIGKARARYVVLRGKTIAAANALPTA